MLVRYIIKTSMFFYKTLRKGITLRSNSKKYLSYAKPIILIISLLNFTNFSYVAVAEENSRSGVNEIKNIKAGESLQGGISDDVEIEFLNPSDLPVPIEPNVFNIRGIISNREGKPIENASVVARTSDVITPKGIITGSDGRFVFESLEEGWWEILVDAEGYAHITMQECVIEIPRRKDDNIKLILDRPVEMRGRVIAGEEQPVANAKVIVASETTPDGKKTIQGHLSQDLFATFTNDKGEFSFNMLKPGKTAIVVEHPDYAPFLDTFGSDAKDVLVKLDHGGTITGRIMDGDKPLIDVEVEIAGGNLSHRQFGYKKTITDNNGKFEARNLPYFPNDPELGGWDYSIHIKATEREFPIYTLRLTKEQPIREVLLQPSDMAKIKNPKAQYKIVELGPLRKHSLPDRPKGTASIKGKVIPKTQDSAKGLVAHLSFYPLPTKENWLNLETSVENNSNFEFSELPEGDYKLYVEPENRLQTEEWGLFPPVKVKLKEGEVKTLTFTQDNGILRGTIKGLNPELYYSVVLKTDDPKNPWFRMMSYITSSRIKEDGTYGIKTLSRGKYLAILQFWTDRKTMPSGDHFYYSGGMEMFEFQSDGKSAIQKDFDAHFYKVTGKVVDADTNQPVEGLKLQLINKKSALGTSMDVLSEKDGAFLFPFVPKGTFKFNIASKDDYPSQIVSFPVVDKDLALGLIKIKRSLAGILVVVKNPELVDKNIYPLAFLTNLPPEKSDFREILYARSQDNGNIIYKPIYPGLYTMVFNQDSHSIPSEEEAYALKILENVEVLPDKITRVKVTLEKGVLTKLRIFSKSQKWLVPFSERFWLKNEEGQILHLYGVTGLLFGDVNLKSGKYQFGLNDEKGTTKSVYFSVDESSKGKIIILEIP